MVDYRDSRFEWDPEKAATNLAKHGVSFDDAAAALREAAKHVTRHDPRHQELRKQSIVADANDDALLYFVVWTPRGNRIRMISARLASRQERLNYERYTQ